MEIKAAERKLKQEKQKRNWNNKYVVWTIYHLYQNRNRNKKIRTEIKTIQISLNDILYRSNEIHVFVVLLAILIFLFQFLFW